jgi:hypothetical protein
MYDARHDDGVPTAEAHIDLEQTHFSTVGDYEITEYTVLVGGAEARPPIFIRTSRQLPDEEVNASNVTQGAVPGEFTLVSTVPAHVSPNRPNGVYSEHRLYTRVDPNFARQLAVVAARTTYLLARGAHATTDRYK